MPLWAPGICYINEDTTSYTYNFWLFNLSSLPEGSTLVAIPATSVVRFGCPQPFLACPRPKLSKRPRLSKACPGFNN